MRITIYNISYSYTETKLFLLSNSVVMYGNCNKYEFHNYNHVKLFYKTNNDENVKDDYSWDSTEIVIYYFSWAVLDTTTYPK